LNNQEQITKIFLANPLGFSEAGRLFLRIKLIPQIENENIQIIDPWRRFESDERKIQEILKKDGPLQIQELSKYGELIAARNEDDLRDCEIVIAVLDGVDVDSGTATEIGFAYGLGKKIIGYRGDMRQTGDNLASTVNLQVEYNITNSGGKILNSLKELKEYLKKEI